MTEYEHVVYSTGYTLKVDPPDRGMDVMHHLITGGLLGGRSLDGVVWEKTKSNSKMSDALAISLKNTHEPR